MLSEPRAGDCFEGPRGMVELLAPVMNGWSVRRLADNGTELVAHADLAENYTAAASTTKEQGDADR